MAEHTHGTYACYVLDRCRCEDCRAANRARLLREQLFGKLAEVLEARVDARAWSKDAACRNRPTYLFFPARGDSGTAAKARKICGACIVRSQCLAANLGVAEGVYGGTSARERRTIRTGSAA